MPIVPEEIEKDDDEQSFAFSNFRETVASFKMPKRKSFSYRESTKLIIQDFDQQNEIKES